VTGSERSTLKPLKIGDIEVANRVLLAPMSGVTDARFDGWLENSGPGWWCPR